MSRLWPESIRLHIGPDAIRLSRAGQAAVELPLTPDWAASLAGLPALPARGRLHVTIADRHARYLRVDWPAGLKAAEREAFTAHRFQTVFGDAGAWAILADQDAVSFPSLACCIPASLLEALRAFASVRRLRLASVEAAFIADYNRACAAFAADGGFARLEAGRVTISLWRDGQWRAVRSQAVPVADAMAAARCLGGVLPTLAGTDAAPVAGILYLAGAATTVGPGPGVLPAGWTLALVPEGLS